MSEKIIAVAFDGSPESIALAFQDVAEAYGLPIDVSIKGTSDHQRLKDVVAEAAKPWRKLLTEVSAAFQDGPLVVDSDLIALNKRRVEAEVALLCTVDALIEFEAEHKIGEGKN